MIYKLAKIFLGHSVFARAAVTSKVSVMDLIIEASVRIPVTCTVVRKGWNFTAEQQAKLAKEKKEIP